MEYKVEIEPDKNKNTILVWTDGASRSHADAGGKIKDTDKSAYGYYMTYKGAEKEEVFTGYGLTNNFGELSAVIEALKALKRYDIPVKIHSDSAYVVNTINNGWYKGWRRNGWDKKGGLANRELWMEVIELYEKFKFISVIKVKGHSTNAQNNHVDEILNLAMDEMEERG